jgi:hypothetical protein
MKLQRWYEVIEGIAYIYDSGHKRYSLSVSIVPVADLQYYKNNFILRKIWS